MPNRSNTKETHPFIRANAALRRCCNLLAGAEIFLFILNMVSGYIGNSGLMLLREILVFILIFCFLPINQYLEMPRRTERISKHVFSVTLCLFALQCFELICFLIFFWEREIGNLLWVYRSWYNASINTCYFITALFIVITGVLFVTRMFRWKNLLSRILNPMDRFDTCRAVKQISYAIVCLIPVLMMSFGHRMLNYNFSAFDHLNIFIFRLIFDACFLLLLVLYLFFMRSDPFNRLPALRYGMAGALFVDGMFNLSLLYFYFPLDISGLNAMVGFAVLSAGLDVMVLFQLIRLRIRFV